MRFNDVTRYGKSHPSSGNTVGVVFNAVILFEDALPVFWRYTRSRVFDADPDSAIRRMSSQKYCGLGVGVLQRVRQQLPDRETDEFGVRDDFRKILVRI